MAYLIVGAGLWGLTMARLIAEELDEAVEIIESRSHLGGNSWSYFDEDTGIECHKYGSHIFHTADTRVWKFIRRFANFTSYRHKVLASNNGKVYTMPINLFTINAIYGKNFTPQEAREFIASEAGTAISNRTPENLEEKALSQIGYPLYETFIRDYTAKQWGKPPSELSASIISRLPVRFSYDISYFSDPFQGVPEEGYGKLFEKMADHPNIHITFNCEFENIRNEIPQDARILFTGVPDALFNYKYGTLEWRSLNFEWEKLPIADYQGTTVMNYTDAQTSFTRIHEFKHYNPERQEIFSKPETIICREYPAAWKPGMNAYYPVPGEKNEKLYELYAKEAAAAGIILGGRLGKYKYLDMDKAIGDAIACFRNNIQGSV